MTNLPTSPLYAESGRSSTFSVDEVSIDQIHSALLTRRTTCVQAVHEYFARIEAYEPVFNAFIEVNLNVLSQAAALDAAIPRANRGKPGLTGPLYCIPIAVKDAVDSAEMPSSGGSSGSSGGSAAPSPRTWPPSESRRRRSFRSRTPARIRTSPASRPPRISSAETAWG